MYGNAPAALGICEYTDSDDPNASWSLRVFNDYDTGFKAHFPVPSPILFRMVFNVIPEWVPGPFPLGFSFSSQEYIDSAVASNGGNAAYKQYYWESGEIIGPKPDFAKGFGGAPAAEATPAIASSAASPTTSVAVLPSSYGISVGGIPSPP